MAAPRRPSNPKDAAEALFKSAKKVAAPAVEQLDQLRQFRRRSPPLQFSVHHRLCQRRPVMFLHTDLSRRDQAMGNGEQPGLAIAMPVPIDGDRFHAEIDRSEMGASGDACVPKDRGGEQPAEPGGRAEERKARSRHRGQ